MTDEREPVMRGRVVGAWGGGEGQTGAALQRLEMHLRLTCGNAGAAPAGPGGSGVLLF